MSDPKLKEAMAEIRAIITKHDIAAQVTLVSQASSEFMYVLDPSWSLVQFTNNGDGSSAIQFRSMRAEFESKELHHKVTEQSVWLLLAIKDLAGRAFLQMEGIEKKLREVIEIDHTPLANFEPHKEQ